MLICVQLLYSLKSRQGQSERLYKQCETKSSHDQNQTQSFFFLFFLSLVNFALLLFTVLYYITLINKLKIQTYIIWLLKMKVGRSLNYTLYCISNIKYLQCIVILSSWKKSYHLPVLYWVWLWYHHSITSLIVVPLFRTRPKRLPKFR